MKQKLVVMIAAVLILAFTVSIASAKDSGETLEITAKVPADLLNDIDKEVDSLDIDDWGISEDQFKIMLAVLAWGEGNPADIKCRYAAHSSDGADVWHKHVPKLFHFSSGLGPFQITATDGWTTIDKLNSKKALEFTINKHKTYSDGTFENLEDVRSKLKGQWYAYEYKNGPDDHGFEESWKEVTGTNWNDVKNTNKETKNSPLNWMEIKNELSDTEEVEDKAIRPIGKKKWTISKGDGVIDYKGDTIDLNKDLDTWLISAKKLPEENKATSYEYYYTYDDAQKIEIWAYSNPSDIQHDNKSIFVRTYTKPGGWDVQRRPDNDGFTLNHPVFELDEAEETIKTRDTVLLLDASGSMYGTPMAEMKEAAKIFCSDVLAANGENRVAIVVYASNVEKTLDFTPDQDSLNSTIDSVSSGGGTNIGAGIDSASSMLSSSDADIKNIVLLTDGLPQSGSYKWTGKYSSSDISTYYRYANYVYERCSELKQNYNIYTLGFFHSSYGRELDFGRKFLNDIQNKGYYDVTDANNLKFVFEELAEDIIEEDYPIIIVHGVMGGKLYDGDDLVWVDEGKVKTFRAKLERLANDLNTPANGMNLNAPGIEREYGIKDNCRELVDDLCEEFPNRSIYFYSYDWRKSNKDSAAGLNNLINDAKAQTGYSKVDLVCHSMGGLVASSYVKQYGTNDARYIITLATPYEGSPEIISRTLDERALGSDAKISGWFLARNGLTKEIMAGIPSSSELVPTERYFKSTNFLKIGNKHLFSRTDEDITYDNYCNIMSSIFGNKNYDSAVTFQSSTKDVLLNLDNTYFAVGTGMQTVDTVFINKEESLDKLKVIELTYNNRGDGTVPYESSTMNGPLLSYKNVKDSSGNTRYREFNADHTGILSHSGALLWIENILSQKSNPYEESDKINYRGYTVVRIACPIDVTIDVNGEILSSNPESGSTYVSNGRLDFIDDDGVSICLEDIGTVYDINIVGTGEGTMDYDISWYDADNTLTETRSLEAVPITMDTMITTTTDNIKPTVLNIDSDGDGVVDTRWSVDASGETVVVDLDQGISSISSIANLQSTNDITWVNWTWTNPTDPDFLHTEIYLNGAFQVNTSAEFFNATGLEPETEYTLSTHTVDISGNINETWVNSTAKTSAELASDTEKPAIQSVVLFPANTTTGSTINVAVDATDNIDVTEVIAGETRLTETDDVWQGSITAPSSIGSYSLLITAKDAAGNVAEASVPYSVVQLSGGANIAVSPRSSSIVVGNSVTLNIKVKNTQNIDDTFKVNISVSELPATNQANIDWFSWTEQGVKLRAGEEILLPLEVEVPDGTALGLKLFRANVNSETSVVTGFDTGYLKVV